MASNRGSSSSHQAPPADAAQRSLNPQFLAMPATELVAHLERLLEGKSTLENNLRMAAVREQVLRAQIEALQLQLPGRATGTRRRGGVVGGNVPRTSYRAQRMRAKAPAALPSSGDESVGLDTSVDTTSNEEGDDLPARKTWKPSSLRMNATGGSPLQAKQPRRRRRNAQN